MINYLRLSVTDRCNLRCIYCVPKDGIPLVPHGQILRYEEMLRLVKIVVGMGVKKVRVTGGEPLARRGIVWFIERLNRVEGIQKVTLTTNGVLLKEMAGDLKQAGLKGINISLDSLNPLTFKAITGADLYQRVREGIVACEEHGISPIKLNAVIMRGINDNEIVDLASLTLEKEWHVRFIEFMPVSNGVRWSEQRLVGHKEILERLERHFGQLIPLPNESMGGPAKCYRISGSKGVIGLISPVTHNFCSQCNRIRITARGGLKTCLFAKEELPLIDYIRSDKSDEELRMIIQEAVAKKARSHRGLSHETMSSDYMSQIGG